MRQKDFEHDWPLWVLYGPVCALALLLLFGVDIAAVHGGSMAPHLRHGEVVVMNRAAYGLQLPFINSYLLFWDKPQKNDIVVFESLHDGRLAVKRGVGVGGDSIVLGDAVVVVGGRTYDVSLQAAEQLKKYSSVPDTMVFVVGDNPGRSTDSRHYGLVPLTSIRGRVLFPRRSSKPEAVR